MVFLQIPCLTELTSVLTGNELHKKWFKNSDKRYISQTIQKFLDYNKNVFEFLNITPIIEGSDREVGLYFRSTSYIGAIPLRSPVNGKPIGDFIITPRYTNDKNFNYLRLLNIIEQVIKPEYKEGLPLLSKNYYKPPIYYEAVIYIKLLFGFFRFKWNKFISNEKICSLPSSSTNWKKYIDKESNPENKFRFPNKKNQLSTFHNEFFNLKYVFEVSKSLIYSSETPYRIQIDLDPIIKIVSDYFKEYSSLYTKCIDIKASDSKSIKQVKEQANKILSNDKNIGIAWRLDYNIVFERFVQYLFDKAIKEIGGRVYDNTKFYGECKKPFYWQMNYLEPDLIFVKNNIVIPIDAKYKANFFAINSFSEILKNEHRADLHQILSYTSFDKNSNKSCILCYPGRSCNTKNIKYHNRHTNTSNLVKLISIPLDPDRLNETKSFVVSALSSILSEHITQ